MHNISRALRKPKEHKLVPIGTVGPLQYMNMYGTMNDSGEIRWLDGSTDNKGRIIVCDLHKLIIKPADRTYAFFVKTRYRRPEDFPLDPMKTRLAVNDTHVSFLTDDGFIVETLPTGEREFFELPSGFIHHACPQFHYATDYSSNAITKYHIFGEGTFDLDVNQCLVGRTDSKYIVFDTHPPFNVYTMDRNLDEPPILQRIGTREGGASTYFVHRNILVISFEHDYDTREQDYYFYEINDNSLQWLWVSTFSGASIVDDNIRVYLSSGEYFDVLFR